MVPFRIVVSILSAEPLAHLLSFLCWIYKLPNRLYPWIVAMQQVLADVMDMLQLCRFREAEEVY